MSAATLRSSMATAGFVMLLGSLTAAHAQAQQAVPIKVEVAMESSSLSRAWGDDRVPQVEAALAAHWQAKLSERYPHWDFHLEERQSYATVTLKVTEQESRRVKISMSAERADGAESGELWAHTWLEPVDFDLGQRPPGSLAEQAVREKSDVLFGKPEEESVRMWLAKTVPLGNGGQWTSATDPAELRVITALPWERFKALKGSVFMVQCHVNDELVPMQGAGTLDPRPFESEPGISYEALVLKPEKIGDTPVGGTPTVEVDDLQLRTIYLLEERLLDPDFFF